MKELSVEEKAKRYDESIKRLEDIKIGKCEKTFIFTEGLFDYLFPELRESEDEKIRKSLSAYFAKFKPNDMWDADFSVGNIVVWLEKQCEQKPAWSDEDERMLKWLCRIVHSQRVAKVITLKEETELGEWMDKWLNHNPQPHWKPSDEQMEALSAINVTGDISYAGQGQDLINLYNELQNLMGE